MDSIELLTCSDHLSLNYDDQILFDEFLNRNITPSILVWNNLPKINNAIIRSCWDYYQYPDKFLSFIKNNKIQNSYEVVKWNIDKIYLKYFREKDILIVPTSFDNNYNWSKIIIKPRISNAGNNVTLHNSHFEIDNTMMAQQFLEGIKDGELSVVFIKNNLSHCIIKNPDKNQFKVQHLYGGKYKLYKYEKELCSIAEKVNSLIPYETLYSRIDFIQHENKLYLSEVELIEPWLHFYEYPQAAKKLVDIIVS